METTTQAVTFGRFNLPHPGHVKLVERMLQEADQAYVALSSAKHNNKPALRSSVFRRMCEIEGLDSEKINFFLSGGPYLAVGEVKKKDSETLVVLGVDQKRLGEKLRDDLGVKFVPNEVRFGSSTVVRYFLEQGDEKLVREIYYDDPLLFLEIQELRREELSREKS